MKTLLISAILRAIASGDAFAQDFSVLPFLTNVAQTPENKKINAACNVLCHAP